ncbi:MAG: hypothetical protein M0Q95_11040 [Porticoccaceae bacterium]|nr:hypothetical protein [Porticoccaceae bacterium]
MQFLTILKLIVSILPLLIDAIKLIESAMPGTGNGEAKLSAVRSVVESAYKASTDTFPVISDFETVWPVMEKSVSGLVSAFNRAGEFKK